MDTLEQQLNAIREANGLNALSIHVASSGKFYAFAHKGGECETGDRHADTIAEAIMDAVMGFAVPLATIRTNPHTGQTYTVMPVSDIPAERHECEQCEDTGRIYNNADPTSGQFVDCECGA